MSIYGNPVMMGGSGGGGVINILSGDSNPSSSAGHNGSVFLQYYTLEDSGEGWFARPGYICASAGDIGTVNGRHYYKTDSNPAIVIFCMRGNYMQPHLASTIASACSYWADDGGGPWNYDHTYTINGTVWYFFSGSYGFSYGTAVTDYPVVTSESFDFGTQANAERFLEIARVSTVQQSLIGSSYAKVSGAWQDLIGTDIDDIDLGGGGGNAYTSLNAPSSGDGENGQYWFQLQNGANGIAGGSLDSNAVTGVAGWEFTANSPMEIIGLRAIARSTYAGTLKFGDLNGVLVEKSVNLASGQWVEVSLDSPIQLVSGNNYIVMLFGTQNTLTYANTNLLTLDSRITYVQARYGSYPGNKESGNLYAADIVISGGNPPYRVKTQYYKTGGVWVTV